MVTQVGGAVVPVDADGDRNPPCADGNLQECLDAEEGAPVIDAVLDAAQAPGTFRPSTTVPVIFRDVWEGSALESSFGYYNVGEDATNTNNLHPILGCGVPEHQYSAEAGGYVQTAEAGTVTTVDFAAEAAAGRYHGGVIGFYLLTPEGRPDGVPNCGDLASIRFSYPGVTYFTEPELNHDGYYVHSLVYASPQDRSRFYFAFEDLFRNGDDDFEDMLVQVTGLIPDLIFTEGFDSGSLAPWSSSVTDAGDLAVSAAAGVQASPFGLAALVDNVTDIFVQDDSPDGERRYRARFYFDPNGFDPGEAEGHARTRIFIVFAGAPSRRVATIVARRKGGQYGLIGRARLDDDSQADISFVPISDAPHAIELDLRRASGPEAKDGSFQLWIDGVSAATLTGLDNHLSTVDFVRMGALSVKSGAAGTLHWDELESRRDAYIGPLFRVTVDLTSGLVTFPNKYTGWRLGGVKDTNYVPFPSGWTSQGASNFVALPRRWSLDGFTPTNYIALPPHWAAGGGAPTNFVAVPPGWTVGGDAATNYVALPPGWTTGGASLSNFVALPPGWSEAGDAATNYIALPPGWTVGGGSGTNYVGLAPGWTVGGDALTNFVALPPGWTVGGSSSANLIAVPPGWIVDGDETTNYVTYPGPSVTTIQLAFNDPGFLALLAVLQQQYTDHQLAEIAMAVNLNVQPFHLLRCGPWTGTEPRELAPAGQW
jgi:hypothetical protein